MNFLKFLLVGEGGIKVVTPLEESISSASLHELRIYLIL